MTRLQQVKYTLVRWLDIHPQNANASLSDLMDRIYYLAHHDRLTMASLYRFEDLIKDYYLSGGR